MKQQGISKLDLKRQNRMQILKLLKHQGPTSRIDIATTLELTRAAVTIIINEMIEQGIVNEIGEQKSPNKKPTRGRKKILVDINHNYKFAMGIMADNEQVSIGLTTLEGAILDKRSLFFNDDTTFSQIIDFMRDGMEEIKDYNCLDESRILGIGFTVTTDACDRLMLNIDSDGYFDYSVIKSEFDKFTSLPILFDNAISTLASANIDFNKEKSMIPRNAVLLYYGNSLYSAIIQGNDPLRMPDRDINLIEEIRIGADGETAKDLITPNAIISRVKQVYSDTNTPFLYESTVGNVADVNLEDICTSYDRGETAVVQVVDEIREDMLILINNIMCIINPDKIIIHGMMGESKYLLDLLLKSLDNHDRLKDKILHSCVGKNLEFLSGCSLAIRELFFTRGGFDI